MEWPVTAHGSAERRQSSRAKEPHSHSATEGRKRSSHTGRLTVSRYYDIRKGGSAHWYPLIPAPSPTFLPVGPRSPPPQILTHSHPSANRPHPTLTLSPSPIPHHCKTCTSSCSSSSSSIGIETLCTHRTRRLPLDVIYGSFHVQLEVTDIECGACGPASLYTIQS